ncbi:alpha/beta hydrolase [Roseiconus lacunae]|uniref:alpha/beta hydrolase n=1 Tax=Roseiconus lacunae TaxID=2605694 RepID=UPI001E2A0F8F|nr:alpha/beta-hydrolase family protein [Roseiconus lacunae]MCD0462779.1 alpha/beta-hydrolase family protein [Roseiconus lacunae]
MKKLLLDYKNSFSFVGLSVAGLFFAASVTPSLLPRTFVVQGILSGFSLAIGYGVGLAGLFSYQFLGLREPEGRVQVIAKRITVVLVAVVFIGFIWRMTAWQNSIRELMQMEPLESAYPYRTAIIAIAVGAILVAFARAFGWSCRFVADRLDRFVPRRIASAVAVVFVSVVIMTLSNDLIVKNLLNAADHFFANLDEISDEVPAKPTEEFLTGSDESLVSWNSIGRQGKFFLAGGPTKTDIETLWQSDADHPIRVYVGLRSRPTPKDRAKLAIEELKRVGGFERSVLIVATPTGTGWLDPSAVDTIEYLHGGDTAIVSTQYSYLPSWITILIDPERSIRSAQALFDEVYSHWKTLPKTSRPKLYLQGLSLGSLGSEICSDIYTVFEDPIDGAVWSGPPFPSRRWRQAINNRVEGTPVWLPKFRDGRLLRFTAQENALEPDRPWGPMRNVYIQHASDPMVWFSPDLAWSRPRWLGDSRGPDVSSQLRWYPIITFLQIGFDIPMATTVPIGFGHNYSPSSYIDAWVAVTDPPFADPKQRRQLKDHFRSLDTPKP